MNRKEILNRIKKLNLPLWHYVVVWSWPMIVHNIKESDDIDIVVSEELFNIYKQKNDWQKMPRTYPDKMWEIYLRHGNIELYLDVNCWAVKPNFEELMLRSEIIEWIRFASLEDVLKFKIEYSKTKEKHLKDIETIKTYLSKNNL